MYDARLDRSIGFGDHTSRGVSTWLDPTRAAGQPCRRRIVAATVDARLISLDAANGKLCEDFGDHGVVDLQRRAAQRAVRAIGVRGDLAARSSCTISSSSAPASPTTSVPTARAARCARSTCAPARRSGRGIPCRRTRAIPASRPGAARRRIAPARRTRGPCSPPIRRAISCSSPPAARAPTTTAASDSAQNRYANSITALRASTGKVVWSFQTVHHDLWDYDNASPPALVTVQYGGRARDAVLQATKTGQLFVLDRDTGTPIVPVTEMPVPRSTVPGEEASPTQPQSAIGPLSPQRLSPDSVWGANDADRAACRATIADAAQRRPVHAAEPRGIGRAPVEHRRRALGRRRVRSDAADRRRADEHRRRDR